MTVLLRHAHSRARTLTCFAFFPTVFRRKERLLPFSETQGLLAGTMRYFRAKVYFKSWRAPGTLLLPNQFQKWSNSVPLIGFLSGQSARSSSRVTLSPSYTKQPFFIDRPSCLARATGTLSWKFSEKKIFNEAEEIARLNMGLGTYPYSSINFLGGFNEGIS